MSNQPVSPATCPVCLTPINRLRIAVMGGLRPTILCNHCNTLLRPDPVMHRIWSVVSFILFFVLFLLIIRVARFFIIFKAVLILGVGVLMLAFSSSFMLFEKVAKK
ncbi:MAG: hypothetical protein ACI9EW_002487 [Cellvibrionaceae bacterium]|jgi:hypothetical protein